MSRGSKAMWQTMVSSLVAVVATAAAAATAPLRFEENLGQYAPGVAFVARDGAAVTAIGTAEIALTVRSAGDGARTVRVRFVGGDPLARARGVEALPGVSRHFRGRDPARWVTGARSFARVEVGEVYPGIDVAVHGAPGRLEYDLVLAPGADPGAIRLAIEGACPLELDRDGSLVLGVGRGRVRHERPRVYQVLPSGERRTIASRYVREAPDRLGIEVDPYDRGLPLVVDPVIEYSTYFGGSAGEAIRGLALDASGAVVAVGSTTSADLPLRDPIQATFSGAADVFITKLDPAGSGVVFSTYLGGAGIDIATGVAVDAAGNIYLTGHTTSLDFPTLNAFQPELSSAPFGAGTQDAFVAKLTSAGTLAYSTYLGGYCPTDLDSLDQADAIAVDAAGAAYVTGYTNSGCFPLQDPIRFASRAPDAFVTKLDPGGSSLAYSTILHGGPCFATAEADKGFDIAVDALGSAYVVGWTNGCQFPLVNPVRDTSDDTVDGFVSKFAPDGRSLVYSTYLGGTGTDYATAVAVDGGGSAHVSGLTTGPFPLVNPFQPAIAGGADAFVSKLAPGGSTLVYSTYLGGVGSLVEEWPNAIAVDAAGAAHVVGRTDAVDFPTRDPLQTGPARGPSDAFVTRLAPDGTSLLFSTYLGGSGTDEAYAVAVAADGTIHVAGRTDSSDFPLLAPFQAGLRGSSDGFVTRICTAAGPAPDPVGNSLTVVRTPTAGIRLQWTDVAGATSYNVYGDVAKGGSFLDREGTAPSGSPGLELPLPPEPSVLYRVAAAAGCAESPK